MNSMKALGASLGLGVVLLFSVTVAFIPLYLYDVNPGPMPAQNVSYTTNGLTCPVPPDYSTLGSLMSAVTQDPRFVNLADGETYVFGNGEMITGRTVTTGGTYDNDTGKAVGGTTIYLPDAMELVFYGFGPTTFCGQIPGLNSPANQVIVVQVPLQSGEFNMTGATFFNSMFP